MALMTDAKKRECYTLANQKITALCAGETDTCLLMATMISVLKQSFAHFYWIGFYRTQAGTAELIVGPYQGTPACLHVPENNGVCGTAATKRSTQIVDNVHDFEGHIACDPLSFSEIVIPIINRQNELIAVLDIDSKEIASFNHIDQQALEPLCTTLFANGKQI